jgi:hypothetical protein
MSRDILLLGFLALPCLSAATFYDSSFEQGDGWTITNGGLSGGYTQTWASDGSWSFYFYRAAGATTAGSYLSISRNLDLTGVTGFVFDVQDQGIDVLEPLQFFVDGVLMFQWSNNGWPGGAGSGWGNTAQTYNVQFNLSTSYSGVHTFTIRNYATATYSPADPKTYWIDNLRTLEDGTGGGGEIPEPSTAVLLTAGLTAAAAMRRRELWRR